MVTIDNGIVVLKHLLLDLPAWENTPNISPATSMESLDGNMVHPVAIENLHSFEDARIRSNSSGPTGSSTPPGSRLLTRQNSISAQDLAKRSSRSIRLKKHESGRGTLSLGVCFCA